MNLFLCFELIIELIFQVVFIVRRLVRIFCFFIFFAADKENDFGDSLIFDGFVVKKIRIVMEFVTVQQVFQIKCLKRNKQCNRNDCH